MNRRVSIFSAMIILFLFTAAGMTACSGDNAGKAQRSNPVEPSQAFLDRQAQYLDYCVEAGAPGMRGGKNGQVCRAYVGADTYDEAVLYASLDKINARHDTADFDFNTIIRILCIDRRNPCLPEALRTAMEETTIGFKYWLQEPGPDNMCWWSENHQVLFHSAELLAGQLFPDEVFTNSGMTGTEHVVHARPLLERWLHFRGTFGFSEWHSNVYFNEDIPPLVNLVDFAEDEDVRTRAAMVLDLLAFDMACNYHKGFFATTHGRTYPDKLLEGLNDSTREAAWLMLGLSATDDIEDLSSGNFSATFLATSDRYFTPALLEDVAADGRDGLEHRQRDSIDFEEGPDHGIGYDDHEDVMFWWGMTGYVAPQTITGSFDLIDTYNLWEGFTWSDLKFLKPFVGSPFLVTVAETYEEMARGVALEAVNTYTYRTPHYQLSGAQDFKPGSWTAQVHIWQATIDGEAYVFTTYPGGIEGDYMGGEWTGGFVPRATMHRNVGVFQYRRPRLPIVDEILFVDYSHACFPRNAFDEVIETGNWVAGRKGDAYVALYSQHPTEWSAENDFELIACAKENVWIIELGDAGESGTFAGFVAGIEAAPVSIAEIVSYGSPSLGQVEVGWEGPMIVGGEAVDLGPYDRWDNVYSSQAFGSHVTTIELDGLGLELDFEGPGRRILDGG